MSLILVTREEKDRFLMHYRTKGSKNGVRLYQNKDGSYTPLGREHYGIGKGRKNGSGETSAEKDKKKPKSDAEIEKSVKSKIQKFNDSLKKKRDERIAAREKQRKKDEEDSKDPRDMLDKELNDRIKRLQLEKQYSDLVRERKEREMSPLVRTVNKLIREAAENLAKKTLSAATDAMLKKMNIGGNKGGNGGNNRPPSNNGGGNNGGNGGNNPPNPNPNPNPPRPPRRP